MKKKELKINNEIGSDFKAVSRASSLIAQGVNPDELEILPIGGARRAFSKEIEKCYAFISEVSNKQIIRIESNREGLYDMLPEGVFHKLATGTEVLDEDVMIEDIRTKRQEETEARKFFAPFEIELNHLRLQLEIYETRLDMQTSYNEMSNLLIHSWPELQILNSKQRVIWMHFIPEIQYHKNDLNYIEQFLNLLLNIPVNLQLKRLTRPLTWIDNDIQSKASLGNCSLGISTILTQEIEIDVEVLEIRLGPTYHQLIKSYLPNEENEIIINTVLDYLLPAELDHQIIYDLLPEVKSTFLGQENQESISILGHTTYL